MYAVTVECTIELFTTVPILLVCMDRSNPVSHVTYETTFELKKTCLYLVEINNPTTVA